MYPKSIQNLIDEFAKLPSIGPKTAERFVFYLLKKPSSEITNLGHSILHLKDNVKLCTKCFNFDEHNPCSICSDAKRDQKIICVVAKNQDIIALEKTKLYIGTYHVLGGYINPLENVLPGNIKLKELISRIKNDMPKEIILALNPDSEGEATSSFIIRLLKQFKDLKITRLARGLPIGADLEYADEVTLENAINDRKEI